MRGAAFVLEDHLYDQLHGHGSLFRAMALEFLRRLHAANRPLQQRQVLGQGTYLPSRCDYRGGVALELETGASVGLH